MISAVAGVLSSVVELVDLAEVVDLALLGGGMLRHQAPPDRRNWHECVAEHCNALMPPELPFCGPHWRQLPGYLREQLRDTQPGDREHLRAMLVASTHLRDLRDTHTHERRN